MFYNLQHVSIKFVRYRNVREKCGGVIASRERREKWLNGNARAADIPRRGAASRRSAPSARRRGPSKKKLDNPKMLEPS
jgi:hypothetical protein